MGVLAGIEDGAGFDLRDCESFVGTSAGSIVAAHLAAGRSPRRPRRSGPSSTSAAPSRRAASPGGGRRGHAGRRAWRWPPAPPSRRSRSGSPPPAARCCAPFCCAACPVPADSLDRAARAGRGVGRALRRPPAGHRRGPRHGTPGGVRPPRRPGRHAWPRRSRPRARCRGCSRPVQIGGREYVDGGVWSPTNLDAAPAGRDTHVLCLNPTASLTAHPDAAGRDPQRLALGGLAGGAGPAPPRRARCRRSPPTPSAPRRWARTSWTQSRARGCSRPATARDCWSPPTARADRAPPVSPGGLLAPGPPGDPAATARARPRAVPARRRRAPPALAPAHGVGERAHVGAGRRLQDVGRDALARAGHAADLEHHRGLAERVLAAGDRVDPELAQPRVDRRWRR